MTILAFQRSELAAAPASRFVRVATSTASASPGVVHGRIAAAAIKQVLDSWFEQTLFVSSVAQMTSLPSYREIVRLGTLAVPFLLIELQNRPADWFLALAEITKADPVPANARGDFIQVRNSWLQWGRQHGFI